MNAQARVKELGDTRISTSLRCCGEVTILPSKQAWQLHGEEPSDRNQSMYSLTFTWFGGLYPLTRLRCFRQTRGCVAQVLGKRAIQVRLFAHAVRGSC
eukprot:3627374-Amphidinium_carterae.2